MRLPGPVRQLRYHSRMNLITDNGFTNMNSRFAAYFAASNRTFAQTFPTTLVTAAALRYLSDSWFWLVPAVIAAIEAAAKAYEMWARKRSR